MKKYILSLLAVFASLIAIAQLPTDFYDQLCHDAFNDPMGIVFDEQGRMFVWEKQGKVWIVEQEGTIAQEPFLDLTDEIGNWKDHGLMGFSLDQDFLENGRCYLLYAVDFHHYENFGTAAFEVDSLDSPHHPTFGRVSSYIADPATNLSTILPDSRNILLGETHEMGIPLYNVFHGLGSIIAAEDGTLLISVGDGATNVPDVGGDATGTFASRAIEKGILRPDQDLGSYKAQYLKSLQGKILRIDALTGNGLPSNPFFQAGNPRTEQSRIWSVGFRNPYRICIRPGTSGHEPSEGKPGIIMVGDVGNGSWEELNLVDRPGMNFGWPLYEGIGHNWGFWSMDILENPMAPNPLFGNGGCEEAFFKFSDLLVRPFKNQEWTATNPCNPSQLIPAELYPMVERLPLLAWSNARWNPPARAVIPDTLENDIQQIELSDDLSSVEGENFNGYSSLAGAFYTGSVYPEKYQGKYFAVDFSGWIKMMDINENNELVSVENFHTNSKDIIHLAYNPVDETLYYINIQNEIRKITFGGNPPPVAIIDADHFFGPSPLDVQFDGSSSFDSNLPLVNYLWNFGDGTASTEVQPSHTFQTSENGPKSFEVSLTVEDAEGATHTTTKIVSINNTPPEVNINSFQDGDRYPITSSSLLRLSATVNDQESKDEELTYEWRVFFHHNDHYHPEPVDFNHESYLLVDPYGCDQEIFWYRIELTVTDPQGLSNKDVGQIFPYCGDPFIQWTSLTAIGDDRHITLDWETIEGDSVQYYEIQRGSDFNEFQTIGTMDAKGSPSYQFIDLEPLRGTNFYRIKVLTEGRAYSFSNLATAAFPTFSNIRLFPNPANNLLNIELKEATDALVKLELFNPAGIPVFSTTWEATPEEFHQKSLAAELIPNGIYFFRITNGEQEETGKIIIRHF